MKRHDSEKNIKHDLDDILEAVLVDAYGEDEQLWAFYQAFKDNISLPADAFIIGEPVSVIQFDYSGNLFRGLTVKCQREDRSVYEASICDVFFIPGSESEGFQAAYRKWLNLEPCPEQNRTDRQRKYSHKVRDNDIDPNLPVELIMLSTKQQSARCRMSGSTRTLTLRSADCHNMVPSEIVVIKPRKQWRCAGHPYLSGEFISSRLDISALDIKPLGLQNLRMWNPEEHYWGEENEPLENWEKQIMDRGPRPEFEMEQIVEQSIRAV